MHLLWDLSSVSQSTWTHHLLRQSLRPLRQDPQGRRSSRSSEEWADLSSSSSSSSTSSCPRGGLQPGVQEWQFRFFSFYVTVWFIAQRNYIKIKFISNIKGKWNIILTSCENTNHVWADEQYEAGGDEDGGGDGEEHQEGHLGLHQVVPWRSHHESGHDCGLDSTLCYIVYTLHCKVYSVSSAADLNWIHLRTTKAWLSAA